MIFPRSPRTTGNEKKFGARSKIFFFLSSILDPKYDLTLVCEIQSIKCSRDDFMC